MGVGYSHVAELVPLMRRRRPDNEEHAVFGICHCSLPGLSLLSALPNENLKIQIRNKRNRAVCL